MCLMFRKREKDRERERERKERDSFTVDKNDIFTSLSCIWCLIILAVFLSRKWVTLNILSLIWISEFFHRRIISVKFQKYYRHGVFTINSKKKIKMV